MASPAADWNHNAHYHPLLLAAVPKPCHRALDAGCGHGAFARRLATVALSVDAIDRDPAVLSVARALSTGVANISFAEADILSWAAGDGYDFVSMIAVLHHLPFEAALERAAALLRPGGVLAILGLDRPRSVLHAAVRSVLAVPVSGCYRITRGYAPVEAPTREPELTIGEIRRRAAAVLPGAVIRQHVLWRYSLVWRKPRTR
ncbi:MAG TPA: class I SAM-dependent methyltransferase [Vicinamibacterales bacterium]|nr:class I SAM-dependent methyltransferase [Vicinamibacterales bacterium]